jgi:hypothetical protein
VKNSYKEELEALQRKEKKKEDLNNNFNKKYPLYSSLKDVRARLELAIDQVKNMNWKKRGEIETAFEPLAECMLETLKGEKVQLERFRIQNIYALSPYDCYRTMTKSQGYFDYELTHIKNDKKINPLTELVSELSGISFNSEGFLELKKAEQDYKSIKLEEKSILLDRNKFKILEQKYSSIAEFETHVENTSKCQGEHVLQEQRLNEIQTKSNSEISAMEDLLYSTSKCRNAKIEKELIGNNFCERFNFFIENMRCISEYPDFAETPLSCSTGQDIVDETSFKKVLCSLESKENPNNCNDNGLDPYWKYRYICSNKAPHVDSKVTSLEQGRMGARELIGENIARGIPTIINKDNLHSAIIGVKSEGSVCKYLIRNYKDQSEKWVDEDNILNFLNEFHFLK